MATFADLPQEILLMILDYLEHGRDQSVFCTILETLSKEIPQQRLEGITNEVFYRRWTRLCAQTGPIQFPRSGITYASEHLVLFAAKRDGVKLIDWIFGHHRETAKILQCRRGSPYFQSAVMHDSIRLFQRFTGHLGLFENDQSDVLNPLFYALTQDAKVENWDLPLSVAVKFRLPKICKYLLEKGADPDALGANGLSALHMLIHEVSWYQEHPRASRMFLDTNSVLFNGEKTAVFLEIIHLLRDAGTRQINYKCAVTQQTPYPCRPNWEQSSSCFHNGQSALHLAAAVGRSPEIIRALIDRGADPTQPDDDGNLPIFYAIRQNYLATAKSLLVRRYYKSPLKDVIVIRKKGSKLLHVACRYAFLELVIYLLALQHDPNDTDDEGRTALHEVLSHRILDNAPRVKLIIERLRAKGGDMEQKSKENISPREMVKDYEWKTGITMQLP